MCKWCGTRYCKECLKGEFTGEMKEPNKCRVCNQVSKRSYLALTIQIWKISRKNNKCWCIDIFRFVVKVWEWNTFPDQRLRKMTKSGVNQRPLAGDAQQRAPNPPNPRAPNLGRNREKRKRRNKYFITF